MKKNKICKECYKKINKDHRKKTKFLPKLKQEFGLEDADYLGLFEKQGHECGTCTKKVEPYNSRKAQVDHAGVEGFAELPAEEKKKHVRGILCLDCHKAMMHFEGSSNIRRYKFRRYVAQRINRSEESASRSI